MSAYDMRGSVQKTIDLLNSIPEPEAKKRLTELWEEKPRRERELEKALELSCRETLDFLHGDRTLKSVTDKYLALAHYELQQEAVENFG